MRGRLHHVVEVDDVSTARADQAYGLANRPSQDHTTAFRSVERLCQHAERQGTHAWQQAIPELREFARNFPKDPQAWVALARARLATGAKRDAYRNVQEALSLNADIYLGPSLSVLAAQGYSETHKWPLVIKHAEAALALRPSDAETLILLLRALISNKEGKSAKAQETVRLLMQADRSRSISLLREVAESSGSAADKHYWLSEALAGARAGGSPPQRQLLRDLAEASFVLDRREDALKLFEEGLADEDTAKSLAQMYLRNQRSKEAMEVYRVALQSFPGSYGLVRGYGQLLLKDNRTAEAIGAISRGAKLAPALEASSLHLLLAAFNKASIAEITAALAALSPEELDKIKEASAGAASASEQKEAGGAEAAKPEEPAQDATKPAEPAEDGAKPPEAAAEEASKPVEPAAAEEASKPVEPAAAEEASKPVEPAAAEAEMKLKFQAAFRAIDTNKSGFIEVNELEAVLQTLGVNLTSEQVAQVFRAADLNGDDRLDIDEYEALVKKAMPSMQ